MTAIDVSSAQGCAIGALIDTYAPQHVITKAYQSVELGGAGAHHTICQAEAARAHGCTVGAYVWLYGGIDGAKQVSDALAAVASAGIMLGPSNPLWLDCETYTDGSYPSIEVIGQAVAECDQRGIACGIYTAAWFWQGELDEPAAFGNLPLWYAHYDGQPTLDPPGFGGWASAAGKQYAGSPVDRSVFRREFAS